MSKLYGRLRGERHQDVTRTANAYVVSILNTYEGKVVTTLYADGTYEVRVNGELKHTGNVNGEVI